VHAAGHERVSGHLKLFLITGTVCAGRFANELSSGEQPAVLARLPPVRRRGWLTRPRLANDAAWTASHAQCRRANTVIGGAGQGLASEP
jgi:hypothetical protein